MAPRQRCQQSAIVTREHERRTVLAQNTDDPTERDGQSPGGYFDFRQLKLNILKIVR